MIAFRLRLAWWLRLELWRNRLRRRYGLQRQRRWRQSECLGLRNLRRGRFGERDWRQRCSGWMCFFGDRLFRLRNYRWLHRRGYRWLLHRSYRRRRRGFMSGVHRLRGITAMGWPVLLRRHAANRWRRWRQRLVLDQAHHQRIALGFRRWRWQFIRRAEYGAKQKDQMHQEGADKSCHLQQAIAWFIADTPPIDHRPRRRITRRLDQHDRFGLGGWPRRRWRHGYQCSGRNGIS